MILTASLRLVTVLALVAAGGTGRAVDRQRPALHRGGVPPLSAALASSGLAGNSYTVEASAVSFGIVEPGVDQEIHDAIVIRVISENAWAIRLIPVGPSAVLTADTGFLPMSRLAWRAGTGVFQPFRGPVAVAAGGPTGPSGKEVRIDLRLGVTDTDPVASLALSIAIELEAR